MEDQLAFLLVLVAYGCVGRVVLGPVRPFLEVDSLQADAARSTRPAAFAMIVAMLYVALLGVWPLVLLFMAYRFMPVALSAWRHTVCHPDVDGCPCDDSCKRCQRAGPLGA